MNQNEFLGELSKWLYLKKVADVDDIVLEYQQHFRLKLADGYSEEEIAAKLGNPKELANQFEAGRLQNTGYKNSAVIMAGMIFVDIFAFLLGVLSIAWVIVLGAATIASGVTSICLVLQIDVYRLIPSMPYVSRFLFFVALLALAVLFALATIYCFLFIRQLIRCYIRWRHNVIASMKGGVILPPLPFYPCIEKKARRHMRNTALVATIVLGTGAVSAYILSSILADSLEFWHVWHWFTV